MWHCRTHNGCLCFLLLLKNKKPLFLWGVHLFLVVVFSNLICIVVFSFLFSFFPFFSPFLFCLVTSLSLWLMASLFMLDVPTWHYCPFSCLHTCSALLLVLLLIVDAPPCWCYLPSYSTLLLTCGHIKCWKKNNYIFSLIFLPFFG